MGYSLLFSPEENNYPVVCMHERITGEQCPSCGISHAFSLFVRGRVSEALLWNPYALQVFIFFVIQFFMRAGISVWLMAPGSKSVIVSYADAIVSAVMMAVVFYPMVAAQWALLVA